MTRVGAAGRPRAQPRSQRPSPPSSSAVTDPSVLSVAAYTTGSRGCTVNHEGDTRPALAGRDPAVVGLDQHGDARCRSRRSRRCSTRRAGRTGPSTPWRSDQPSHDGGVAGQRAVAGQRRGRQQHVPGRQHDRRRTHVRHHREPAVAEGDHVLVVRPATPDRRHPARARGAAATQPGTSAGSSPGRRLPGRGTCRRRTPVAAARSPRSGPNPSPGRSASHGSGTRQPSRPRMVWPERCQVGSSRRWSSNPVCSGNPSSSPWYR